jgi:hypothetical protein
VENPTNEYCNKCGAHDPMGDEAAWHGADCFVSDTKTLFEWSENYQFPTPASLFLDLVGWSEGQLGEPLCGNELPRLGYLELDYLADALKEYASNPHAVEAWIEDWNERELERLSK